jgi:ubiquinone biosynthesis UbiH/UbiF/VisC/COQ6 family hydroxylase
LFGGSVKVQGKVIQDKSAIIIGAGLAGLTLAVRLAQCGWQVQLVAPKADADQGRAAAARWTAIDMDAVNLWQQANVWANVAEFAAPMTSIQANLGPKLLMLQPQKGGTIWGFNLPNHVLYEALLAQVVAHKNHINWVDASFKNFEPTMQGVLVHLDNGQQLQAALLVGADGKNSAVRTVCGIGVVQWPYRHVASSGTVILQNSLDGVAYEYIPKLRQGACALLPQPKANHATCVWMRSANKHGSLSDYDLPSGLLVAALQQRVGQALGDNQIIDVDLASWGHYPLQLVHAKDMAQPQKHVALVADAAHAIHPLGGQGINAGLADVAELVAQLDIAASLPYALEKYQQARRPKIIALVAAVDSLAKII